MPRGSAGGPTQTTPHEGACLSPSYWASAERLAKAVTAENKLSRDKEALERLRNDPHHLNRRLTSQMAQNEETMLVARIADAESWNQPRLDAALAGDKVHPAEEEMRAAEEWKRRLLADPELQRRFLARDPEIMKQFAAFGQGGLFPQRRWPLMPLRKDRRRDLRSFQPLAEMMEANRSASAA